MLKGNFRILKNSAECREGNLKYVIMAWFVLHNLCNKLDDPFEPRWKLPVQHLSYNDTEIDRRVVIKLRPKDIE